MYIHGGAAGRGSARKAGEGWRAGGLAALQAHPHSTPRGALGRPGDAVTRHALGSPAASATSERKLLLACLDTAEAG